MSQNKNPYLIASTLLRVPLLRSIVVLCLAVSTLLPAYSTFFVMPQFVAQLMNNIESDAERIARHLSQQLSGAGLAISRDSVTEPFVAELHQACRDLELSDVHVFSDKGEVVFSTRPGRLGTTNSHPYFWERVAQGKIFSRISSREGRSAEGAKLTRDVAEVYIPFMARGSFRGAFEIYYDVTERKKALNLLLFRNSVTLYSIAFLVLGFSGVALWKASSAIIERDQAEQKLQKTNQSLEGRVAEQTHELQVTQRISIESLASLAEFYDLDTGEHLVRIQEYTGLLAGALQEGSVYAAYMETRPHYIADLQLASLLHDVGKTAVPKEILAKPGQLTEEEFALIKQHTTVASQVLLKANTIFVETFGKDSYLALARDIAACHHERWDGGGYPHGLKGEEIPLSARIVALVDVYDALRSQRPYKSAWSHQATVAEIGKGRGTQFDPHLVDAFVAVADRFERVAGPALGRTP